MCDACEGGFESTRSFCLTCLLSFVFFPADVIDQKRITGPRERCFFFEPSIVFFTRSELFVETFLVEEGRDSVPTWLDGALATPPGDKSVTEIVPGVTSAKIINADMINGWPLTQGTICAEWGGSHFAGIVSLHKLFEILEVLTPVIV